MSDNIESTILKEGRKEGRKEVLSVSSLPVKNHRQSAQHSEKKDMKRFPVTCRNAQVVTRNGTSTVMSLPW